MSYHYHHRSKKELEQGSSIRPKDKISDSPQSSMPREQGTNRTPGLLLHLLSQVGNAAIGQLLNRQGGGEPLNSVTQGEMEQSFAKDFSDVRIHKDDDAGGAAGALNAKAFTVGKEIYMGNDSPGPGTSSGNKLLAHELAHVAQQKSTAGSNSTVVANKALETEADLAAESAAKGESVSVTHTGVSGIQCKVAEETEEEESPGGFLGFLSTIGGAIWSGLKTVGRGIASAGQTVWEGLKSAGQAVWSGLKTAAQWVVEAAGAVWTGIKWISRQLWDKVSGIFLRVARWAARLPERVGRLLAGLWAGVLSIRPWSLEWWESLGKASTWLDFLKWLGNRLVDILEIAGLGEIYETAADFIKFNSRKLTSEEVAKASKVFGSSIDFDLVRVDEYAVIGPTVSDREYVSFHTINAWGDMTDDVLMHELTHVWQYEHMGAMYMPRAIHGQVWGGGYDYGGLSGLQAAQAAGEGIMKFNPEQQGQIVQDFYRLNNGQSPYRAVATIADLPLYANFVKDVSTLSVAQLLTV